MIIWGFTLQYTQNYCPPSFKSNPLTCYYDLNYQIGQNFVWLVFFNLVLLFGLLAILSPHRQTVQDWARYRHQNVSSYHVWKKSLLLDLIWGEKSPALVTMAINLAIATTPLVIWILLAPVLEVQQNG